MKHANQRQALNSFSLVEVLVAMAIFAILLVVLSSLIGQLSRALTYTTSRADQFREARNGFEAMTRRLSQATLNTYLNYIDSSGHPRSYYNSTSTSASFLTNFVPAQFARQSELRFISGPALAGSTSSTPVRPTHAVFFQAPLGFVTNSNAYGGLVNLLNTWGYYIEFNSDVAVEPSFITSLPTYVPRYRYRLMELMEPSDTLSVYKYTAGINEGITSNDPSGNGTNWFNVPLTANPSQAHVLAENIVALIILPKLSAGDQAAEAAAPYNNPNGDGMLAPSYTYDSTSIGQASTPAYGGAVNSKNQLPPLVQITMVAVDEPSFKRLQGSSTTAPDLGLGALFQTVGNTTNAASAGYAQDLQTLQTKLQNLKLTYKVFSTTVAIKAAKWSRNQTN